MTLQSTPTYHFYKALHTGDGVDFVENQAPAFPGLSQSLGSRPVISGMTKTQRKRAQSKKDREVALELAKKYRQDTVDKIVHFDDVATLLDGPTVCFTANP
ncbi:hypothetical protein PHMEG_00024426 [Phytophthora megakarya]|uniref:Uncharacterized protein n=1 Tax=Phytophthora megakarya TaxID=4795 RepID=A0A225VDR0_9STRA|nr:hypothetical protein PHMEG_00024426 [Phytophthora megakarya]